MSFLTKTVSRSIPRSFHITSLRAALSEWDHSRHDSEDRQGEIEFHKNDQLKKQKEGKGHWTKELSSDSEAAVKADREEIGSVEEDIAKLQKEAEEAAKSK